jgi:hypothetical protein
LLAKPSEQLVRPPNISLGLVGTEIVYLQALGGLRDSCATSSTAPGSAARRRMARAETWGCPDEQQVTLEIRIVDRSDPGQVLEKL